MECVSKRTTYVGLFTILVALLVAAAYSTATSMLPEGMTIGNNSATLPEGNESATSLSEGMFDFAVATAESNVLSAAEVHKVVQKSTELVVNVLDGVPSALIGGVPLIHDAVLLMMNHS